VFQGLGTIQQWFDDNKLSVNLDKTNFVLFKTVNKTDIEPVIYMNNVELERVPSVKFLGVTIDECLSWNEHVDKTCKRQFNSLSLENII
jgi:hypothetical protein